MTLHFFVLTAIVVLLTSCSPSTTAPSTPHPIQPTASSTPISALPAEDPAAKPVPLGAAKIVESSGGDMVLASQNGNFQAQLKPAGPNLDIALLKTGTVDQPGFSTGATSGPRDFHGRIVSDLETHPEFRMPLVTVLEASGRPENIDALKLTPEQISVAESLLETVHSETD